MSYTKRKAIVILFVLVCMAAICVGATLAYFVDSASGVGNKIQSGNLAVDFELLNSKTGQWSSLKKDRTPIFGYQYFERGYTDVKVLKVENEGSLAIKWEARILFLEDRSELSDVINVYLLQSEAELSYPMQRSELDAWGTPVTLTYFADHASEFLAGNLQAGEVAYFAIALQMQKDAPDEYLGLTMGEFDIQIVATQFTSESDCHGTDYDIDAEFPCAHSETVTIVDRDATPELRGQQRIVCTNPECGATLKTEDVYLMFEKVFKGRNYENNVVGITNDLESTNIVVPSTYKNVTVTAIDSQAFSGNTKITSITVPQDVRYIGYDAFKGCTSLKSVEFLGDSKLQSIDTSVFQGCSNLESIAIPTGVTNIHHYAFEGCTNLNSVTFADNNALKTVNHYAFQNCKSLQSISFGKNSALTDIGSCAFRYCTDLKSITIPQGVTEISIHTFEGCSALENVVFENADNITGIGERAFYQCSRLVDFEIPRNVTSIGRYAFLGCSSLATITIPNGVQRIRTGTFKDCKGAMSITIPDSVTTIESDAFSNCSSLTGIEIPGSVTSIGNMAFSFCLALESITIPDSVTTIGKYVFYYCKKLQSVEISAGVISIGESAFLDCGLQSAIFKNTDGWWRTKDSSATSGETLLPEDLANPATAASRLKQDAYYWYCTEQTQTE